MKKTILISLTVLVLVLLPFLGTIAISKYSPYVETNSLQTYVMVWFVFSMALIALVLLPLKRFHQPLEKKLLGGLLLFLLVCPLIGIFGLAAPPDISLKMLEHPEREHLRYSLLFLGLLIFGGFILFMFRGSPFYIKKSTKLIMTVIFISAFAEFTWEFTHHYLYPEALKEWVSQGNNADAFGKNYDNFKVVMVGVIGRYLQFIAVIWLSLHLYKLQQIKIWCPIINVLLSLLGIISATLILITNLNLPKGYEFLFLFFIPGIPFFLLYWLGVALLTKFKKSEMTD